MFNPINAVKAGIGGFVAVARGVGKVKAVIDAADDDIDNNGLPEYKDLIADGQALIDLAQDDIKFGKEQFKILLGRVARYKEVFGRIIPRASKLFAHIVEAEAKQ